MSRPARWARIGAAYALEVGSIWLDAADDVVKGVHRALHNGAVTLERAARRVDPDA